VKSTKTRLSGEELGSIIKFSEKNICKGFPRELLEGGNHGKSDFRHPGAVKNCGEVHAERQDGLNRTEDGKGRNRGAPLNCELPRGGGVLGRLTEMGGEVELIPS